MATPKKINYFGVRAQGEKKPSQLKTKPNIYFFNGLSFQKSFRSFHFRLWSFQEWVKTGMQMKGFCFKRISELPTMSFSVLMKFCIVNEDFF